MMKRILFILFGCVAFGAIAFSLNLLAPASSAQTAEEKNVIKVLRQNGDAFAKNDLPTLEKIWANDASVTVFESGHANYGWTDYRDNHLAPEMKEMKNTKYEFSDIKAKVSGNMAYATMKYAISADIEARHVDGAGLATAVLEKRDGNWRIVHWHSSAPRRQPSPSPTPSPTKKREKSKPSRRANCAARVFAAEKKCLLTAVRNEKNRSPLAAVFIFPGASQEFIAAGLDSGHDYRVYPYYWSSIKG